MSEESRYPEPSGEGAPNHGGPDPEGDSRIPEDAFFSPDDPIVLNEGEIPEDAIFSPDDPLTRSDDGEGIVTGIGGITEKDTSEGRGLAWEIRHTADILDRLSRELHENGLAALRVHPETEPMDAMLRSFVAGYLVGQMDEEG